jgi:hypothetical protein
MSLSWGQFLDLVGGILRLDPEAMRAVAQSPDGLRVALAIVLLGSFSDAVGNSPILFLRGVGGARFVVCLLVDTLLSVVRVGVWIVSLTVLVNVLPRANISLADAALVVGLGLAPMLFSFLGLLPLLGPGLLRVLHAWSVVCTVVALGAIFDLPVGSAIVAAAAGWVLALVVGHTVDRLLVRGFGGLTRRLLGVDLALRFGRAELVDQVIAAGLGRSPAAGPGLVAGEGRP